MEDEDNWLRYRVVRMRTALRFATSPEVENILRELIEDGEARLLALENHVRDVNRQNVRRARRPWMTARAT
jgi:hypothetical protein